MFWVSATLPLSSIIQYKQVDIYNLKSGSITIIRKVDHCTPRNFHGMCISQLCILCGFSHFKFHRKIADQRRFLCLTTWQRRISISTSSIMLIAKARPCLPLYCRQSLMLKNRQVEAIPVGMMTKYLCGPVTVATITPPFLSNRVQIQIIVWRTWPTVPAPVLFSATAKGLWTFHSSHLQRMTSPTKGFGQTSL